MAPDLGDALRRCRREGTAKYAKSIAEQVQCVLTPLVVDLAHPDWCCRGQLHVYLGHSQGEDHSAPCRADRVDEKPVSGC